MSSHASCASINGVWYEATTRDTQDALAVTRRQENGPHGRPFGYKRPVTIYRDPATVWSLDPCAKVNIYDRCKAGVPVSVLADEYRVSRCAILEAIACEKHRRSLGLLVVPR